MQKTKVYIHVVDLDEQNEARFQNLCSQLDYIEANRANSFASDLLRRRHIIAHGRLREIVGKHLGIRPNQIVFGKDRYGKPIIVSPATSIEFSLSKSGELATIAISEDCSLGVDVEEVRPLQDKERILHNCLSDREVKIVGPPTTLTLLTVWTLKEAVVKATGEGLFRQLRSVEFDSFSPPYLCGIEGMRIDGRWQIHSFEPRVDYVGAIAVMSNKRTIISMHGNDI